LEFISIDGTSSRRSIVNAAKIELRQDRTTAHHYENEPGLTAGNTEYKPKKRLSAIKKVGFQLVILIVILITFCLIGEINSSIIQAHFLSRLTEQMTYMILCRAVVPSPRSWKNFVILKAGLPTP